MPLNILVHATAKAGGDLNPMVAAVVGLRDFGCRLTVLTDATGAPIFSALGLNVVVASAAWEVGAPVKDALRESENQPDEVRAALVRERVAGWAANVAPEARKLLLQTRPDILLTSFFGTAVGSLLHSESSVPWCALNSTFYIGPNPPRPLERDFSVRAADVFRYSVVPYLEDAALILHATDPLFDYDHRGMPAHHYYTGPLIWEAPGEVPDYITAPGSPLITATLSSLRQDDTPLAKAALAALGHRDFRVAVTVGYGHEPRELDPIPTNAHVAQYIPHSALLERSLLLIAHAGHGSVMKALSYGVPMVLVPWGRDQFGVAARAEQLGVAVVLPKEQLSVRLMAEAIDKVLSTPRYRWAAESAAVRLRDEEALETAVTLITSLADY